MKDSIYLQFGTGKSLDELVSEYLKDLPGHSILIWCSWPWGCGAFFALCFGNDYTIFFATFFIHFAGS